MEFFKKPASLSGLSKRQLISLASLLIILVALPLALFLAQQQQIIYQGKAVGPDARPTNVGIANLHGGGFSISWTSSDVNNDDQFIETTSWLWYGTDPNNLDKRGYDDRAEGDAETKKAFSSTTHHVSLFNLQAETKYYIKIKSGPDLYGLNVAGDQWVKGGANFEQTTPVTLEFTDNPHPIYGYIRNQAGYKAKGVLVYVRLKKGNSPSALLSTVTKEDQKGWVVDIKNTRTEDLASLFCPEDGSCDNDRALIEVQAAEKGTASADYAVSGCSPAPDIALALPVGTPTPTPTGGIPTITPTNSPTPTPEPTGGVPTLTPTPTNTPTPTFTPTPTPTQAPNTANLDFTVKFQGISQQKQGKTVKITLKKADNIIATFGEVGVGADESGLYSGKIMNIPPDTYDIYIKGWAHLQKKFENITLVEGENSQDFSEAELLAGDITGDNEINTLDLGLVLVDYIPNTPPNSPADLTLDGQVNSLDIGLVLYNYSKIGDQ